MRRTPRSRLALPLRLALPPKVVRGVLQGRLVGYLDRSRADRRGRPVVRQWRKHLVAGGGSAEMEPPARRVGSVAAERTALRIAVRAVGVAVRTGARGARHQPDRVFTGISGPLRDCRGALFSGAVGSVRAL